MYGIDEIMDMLDYRNDEETQQKGIELAGGIRTIDVFFMPKAPGSGMNNWENCAKVLANRSDDELELYAFDLMDWIHDLYRPGVEIIIERLKNFTKPSPHLINAIRMCAKRALAEEDWHWMEGIGRLLDNEKIKDALDVDTVAALERRVDDVENDHTINKVLDMLDWNNPIEVQEKGIELGRQVRDYKHFIMPMEPGHTWNVWDNCARILVEKTDKELRRFTPKIMMWIEDMDYPGARKILNRLKESSEVTGLVFFIKLYSKKALELSNHKWLRNMAELLDNDSIREGLPEETVAILSE